MIYTDEELKAAEEYSLTETERFVETHSIKYEREIELHKARCRSDFLAGISWMKEQDINSGDVSILKSALEKIITWNENDDDDWDDSGAYASHQLRRYSESKTKK